jgi:hypothetical protein
VGVVVVIVDSPRLNGAGRCYRSALTSLRFFTVYPAGSVPSLSIRNGQRLHLSFDSQHVDLGQAAFLLTRAT